MSSLHVCESRFYKGERIWRGLCAHPVVSVSCVPRGCWHNQRTLGTSFALLRCSCRDQPENTFPLNLGPVTPPSFPCSQECEAGCEYRRTCSEAAEQRPAASSDEEEEQDLEDDDEYDEYDQVRLRPIGQVSAADLGEL